MIRTSATSDFAIGFQQFENFRKKAILAQNFKQIPGVLAHEAGRARCWKSTSLVVKV